MDQIVIIIQGNELITTVSIWSVYHGSGASHMLLLKLHNNPTEEELFSDVPNEGLER